MERRAWLLKVREGKEGEYLRSHAAVWPELIKATCQAGIRSQTCFLSGRDVIVYEEADDLEAAFTNLLKTNVKKRWDEAMSNILEDTRSRVFDEVFHLDCPVAATDHDS
jgi:L-rhamnose mutarotase